MSVKKTLPSCEKVIFIGDTHYPYEDKIAVQLVLGFLKWFQPLYIYLIGDIIDFYPLSKYSTNPERLLNLQHEIDETQRFLSRVRQICPSSIIIYKPGNHEKRLISYLWKHPEVYSLDNLKLETLLNFKQNKIQLMPYHETLYHGNFMIEHGDLVRKKSAHTAAGMFEKRVSSGISGHTHRLGAYYRTTPREQFVWYENGCLCAKNPEYANGAPDWQHGFSVGYFLKKTQEMYIEQIPIQKNSIFYNGIYFEPA